MNRLRRIATEVRLTLVEVGRIIDGGPFLLLVIGMLSYRSVHDDHWPWWLPGVLFAAACATGLLLGWRKARKR